MNSVEFVNLISGLVQNKIDGFYEGQKAVLCNHKIIWTSNNTAIVTINNNFSNQLSHFCHTNTVYDSTPIDYYINQNNIVIQQVALGGQVRISRIDKQNFWMKVYTKVNTDEWTLTEYIDKFHSMDKL